MSIIGTGIAAGVANTGQTARQQAAINSGRDAQRADSAQQTDKFTISQLHDASATRDADEDMPDGQAPGYEDIYDEDDKPQGDADEQPDNPNDQIHHHDAPAANRLHGVLQPSYDPDAKSAPLFHAINLKA